MTKLIKKYNKILSIFLLIFIFGILNYGHEQLISSPIGDDYTLRLLNKIFDEIEDKYVEEIDESKLIKLGINGILGGLDPYTSFYDRKGAAQLRSITTGKYGGIGFYISMIDSEFTMISPIENSPAKKTGVRSGDVIIRVNGVETKGMKTEDVTDMIKGKEGTEVELTIKRKNLPELFDIKITRKNIRLRDVVYKEMRDNHIGYIKLNHFSQNAAGEMFKALRDLKKSGIKRLILDIRGNQGGLLTSAVDVVDLFVEKGELIVSIKGRNNEFSSAYRSKRKPEYYDKPLVVIVDNVSASASEILAGAVQDLDRGVVIGRKTFGKGLVQTIFHPTSRTALKMTTARYYTPSGRCIDGTKISGIKETNNEENIYYTKSERIVHGGGGITPDVIIPYKDESISELLDQSIFLKFAINYAVDNYDKNIVEINDEILEQFKKFAAKNGLNKKKNGLKEIKKLLEIGNNENYGAEYENYLNNLNEIIIEKNKEKLDLSDPLIINNLKENMNWVLGGDVSKIEATIDDDIYVKKAMDILNEKEKYTKVLQNLKVVKIH